MTPEQKEQQRRSFAFGNVSIHNPSVTKGSIDMAAESMANEPTKEAMSIALRGINHSSPTQARTAVALAIDAHTQALRAENAHLKSVNEKGLAELAILRDRLRLAVEARKAYQRCLNARDNWRHEYPKAEAVDAALRASGVEI